MKYPIMNIQDLPGDRFGAFRDGGLEMLAHRSVREVMATLLGEPGRMIHTMYFDGNQKTWAHRDSHYIDSEETGRMISVWIAAEDIDPGAGRFYVYARSHVTPTPPDLKLDEQTGIYGYETGEDTKYRRTITVDSDPNGYEHDINVSVSWATGFLPRSVGVGYTAYDFRQASSDIMLGWIRTVGIDGVERDYYVRQLWDWKFSADIDALTPKTMGVYARLCGWTLARGHARSGDRIAIAAYLGSGDSFDKAIAEFAVAYADQNERDYATVKQALKDATDASTARS